MVPSFNDIAKNKICLTHEGIEPFNQFNLLRQLFKPENVA